ncbi:MAG TPA: DUF2188 domain-containing protein, partial [Actinomycetota bacterium]|nr:DUF2188 domain-containing protein [Actinomycetota bacterium]
RSPARTCPGPGAAEAPDVPLVAARVVAGGAGRSDPDRSLPDPGGHVRMTARAVRFGRGDPGKAHTEVTSMERTRYDVVPQDDGWAVETGGKSTPAFPTKELAVSAATRRAKDDAPAEVIVHAEDGSVEEQLSV